MDLTTDLERKIPNDPGNESPVTHILVQSLYLRSYPGSIYPK